MSNELKEHTSKPMFPNSAGAKLEAMFGSSRQTPMLPLDQKARAAFLKRMRGE